ncbi:MAG: type IV pilus assembly protein PilM, partial [uncultured bacterium]
AEQYIPVPLSEIHLVWTLLRKDERARVLMIGAPISLIGRYQKIIGAAGLNISSIETETLSVIRALVRGKFPHAIIINVAEEISSLAIVNEGVLMFTYSIPIGGKAINRALELDYGLSNAQSEEYKMTYGISKEGLGDKIRQAVEPVLFSILNETKKALDFYTQKNKESSPIQQIILSGGTAIIPGVDLFFAENIGIETVIADPWQVLVDKNVPKELLEEASSYTIAVGLAMRAYE